jgi:hypothetical protein
MGTPNFFLIHCRIGEFSKIILGIVYIILIESREKSPKEGDK